MRPFHFSLRPRTVSSRLDDSYLFHSAESLTLHECSVYKGHNQWNWEKTSNNDRIQRYIFPWYCTACLFILTRSIRLISCLEKYAEKKIQNVFKLHFPSQGFFLPPVREGFQGLCFCSLFVLFFPKITKNAFKKAILQKCKNLLREFIHD